VVGVLNPSPLVALAYIGGAALEASIFAWAVGIFWPGADGLKWAQHVGYFAGYVVSVFVLSVWLLRWLAL